MSERSGRRNNNSSVGLLEDERVTLQVEAVGRRYIYHPLLSLTLHRPASSAEILISEPLGYEDQHKAKRLN